MSSCLSLGIDIGSETIRLAVAEKNERGPRIKAKASVVSRGISRGAITDREEFGQSLHQGILAISKSFPQEKIWEATIGFNAGLKTDRESVSTIVTHGSGEVTELDIDRGVAKAAAKIKQVNSKVIQHTILSYELDGKSIDHNPIGMRGKKLTMEILFVSLPRQTINQLEEILDSLDVDVVGITSSALVEAPLVLSEVEKTAGVVALNIGSELSTAVVYEHGHVIGSRVFELGSNDITEALALALKISLEEADTIKIQGSNNKTTAKKRETTINKKYKELFSQTNSLLSELGRKKLLPAGVVFTGAGSLYPGIEELAKQELQLPAKKASVRIVKQELDKRELPWVAAYGLAYTGLDAVSDNQFSVKKVFNPIKNLLKNFFI